MNDERGRHSVAFDAPGSDIITKNTSIDLSFIKIEFCE